MSALSSPTPAPVEKPGKPAQVPTPASPGNKGWWIGGIVLLLSIAGVAAYNQWARRTSQNAAQAVAVKTAKAFVGPLEVTLRVSGATAARNFANVTTPLLRGPESRGSMTLLKLAGSGAHVRKGELLAQIDAQTAEDHIDDVKDIVQNATNDIAKRKAEQAVEWETMQQNLRVTRSQAEKARYDAQPAVLRTDIERELMKLSVDEAEARYKQQAGDVEQRRQSQSSELRILNITLDRHKRHLARHEHDLQAFTIYSPMDGLAVMSTTFRGGEMGQVQQGDQVYPGQQIMKVVDTSKMQVEGSISQSDSGDLRIGQPARIGFDAFKDLKFNGRVYSIGALAVGGWRQQNYIRSIPVRVAIEGSDPRLIPDLSAYCDVVLETVPNALQVPIGAVTEQGGKATVMVRNGQGWTERPVTLGKRNNAYVAVTSGLKAGEEIRLP